MDEGGPGCQRCGSLSYSREWHDAFGVLLCNQCKRDEPLMSKGKAKSVYLLTDKDFKGLGCISKENPQRRSWTAMKLYMQSQLEDAAWRRWGGAEGLAEERQRRADAAIDQRLKRKREEAVEEEGGEGSAQDEVANGRLAARLASVKAEHMGPRHVDTVEVEGEDF